MFQSEADSVPVSRWLGVIAVMLGAAAIGFAEGGRFGRVLPPAVPPCLLLALKISAQRYSTRLSWLRLTILELAFVPQLSGHFPRLPLGEWLGLIAVASLAKLDMPEQRWRLFAIYAMPLVAVLSLRLFFS